MIIRGYCAITADILHIGHIRYIKQCGEMCDYLIVGIMSDEIVEKYKGQKPIMPYAERAEIVAALRGVDAVMKQNTFEFPEMKIDIIFDSVQHSRKGAGFLIRRTRNISSSVIKEKIYDTYNRKRKA